MTRSLRESLSPFQLFRDLRDLRAHWVAVREAELDFYTKANVNVLNLHGELSGITGQALMTPPALWEYMKPRQKPRDFPPMPGNDWHQPQGAAENFNAIVMGPHPAVIAVPLEKVPFGGTLLGNVAQRLAIVFDSSVRSGDPLFAVQHVVHFRGQTEAGTRNELLCIRPGADHLRFEDMRREYRRLLDGQPNMLDPEAKVA